MTQLDHHAALIYTMVMVSAADSNMTDSELHAIGDIVRRLPVFTDFNEDELPKIAQSCATMLNEDDGFETVLTVIFEALPAKLRETAYALACDVAAADLDIVESEMTVLQQLRWRLSIDRLTAAAIERGARARHQTA
ncbi:MAG: tellurite resistance TerB family protein [Pseudomonadota bacterium]